MTRLMAKMSYESRRKPTPATRTARTSASASVSTRSVESGNAKGCEGAWTHGRARREPCQSRTGPGACAGWGPRCGSSRCKSCERRDCRHRCGLGLRRHPLRSRSRELGACRRGNGLGAEDDQQRKLSRPAGGMVEPTEGGKPWWVTASWECLRWVGRRAVARGKEIKTISSAARKMAVAN